MTKVIRKTFTNNSIPSISSFSISRRKLSTIKLNDTFIFKEAVKKKHNLIYGSKGDVYDSNEILITDVLDLGVQYDHRVTWLHFDLENLAWWASDNEDDKYTKKNKFNYYTFKLVFTKLDSSGKPTNNSSVWEFDGADFEIPRGITREAGVYQIVLVIEEYQGSEDGLSGNVDDAIGIERFVAKPIRGVVSSSFYNSEMDMCLIEAETQQKAALSKGALNAWLADDGAFAIEEKELGQQYDNLTRYIKFYPEKISKHLDEFNIIAVFKQNDDIHYSLFEKTTEDDLDDWDEEKPLIAWIPEGVYKSSGTWRIMIIAFVGNMNDMNSPEADENGDYYFFSSKETTGEVAKNNLTYRDVTIEPTLAVTPNILSSAGEIIFTSDQELYIVSNAGEKND